MRDVPLDNNSAPRVLIKDQKHPPWIRGDALRSYSRRMFVIAEGLPRSKTAIVHLLLMYVKTKQPFGCSLNSDKSVLLFTFRCDRV